MRFLTENNKPCDWQPGKSICQLAAAELGLVDRQKLKRAAHESVLARFINQLQLDHFRLGSEGIDGRRAVFKVEYGHQVVIYGVHSAKRRRVFIHHRNAGLPAQVFPDCAFHANPGALVHAADFDFLILLELMVYIFLIVGDKVQFALKNADGAEGTDVRLTILAGGEIERAAGFQILVNFIHC